MADEAHEWTDDQIEALSKRFEGVYSQAAKEMREKLEDYMADYERRNEEWKSAVRSGDATESEYRDWRRSQATRRRYLSDMTDTLARDATRANQMAIEMVNDAIPTVYAENANRAAYEVESGLGWDTHSFDLYDQDTVRNMMRLGDEGQILHEVIPSGTPNVPLQSLRVRFDEAKDVRWNRQKYNALLTQSILQGESIPATAKRLSAALNMGKGMATRAARTGMTAAENAGRTDSYQRAKSIGIELEQQWMATLDERTRHSHRQLDGVHVPVGEKFPNGLEFPADPKGAGEEIWNCFVGETLADTDSGIVRSYCHEYSGKLVTIDTASGVHFTCTPNHPILTPSGWVAAELLHKGDNLVVTGRANGKPSRRNPDVDHGFASMKALHELLRMFSDKRATGLSVNFHGDIAASNVEVITKESLLRLRFDTSRAQSLVELVLEDTDTLGLGNGTHMEGFRRVMASAPRIMSRLRVFASLLGGHGGHADVQGLRAASRLDSSISEYTIDNTPTETVLRSELLCGLSRKVFTDEIINVEIGYTGGTHVYNLQTNSGYYFANERDNGNFIIAKNCRCTLVAWFPDIEQYDPKRWSKLPDGMTYEQWKGQKKTDADRGDGNPDTLAGVVRGAPMTFDEANELRGNPNYNIANDAYSSYVAARNAYESEFNSQLDGRSSVDNALLDKLRRERDDAERAYNRARREQNGYRVNCQTCVVANEARRRGYDVEATPNTTGSVNERVSRSTNLAWIDRSTGEHPRYIIYDGEGREDYAGRPIPTQRRYLEWLLKEGTVEEDARYTIEFWWKGRSNSGHIVSLERTPDGLRMYDPQCGETYDEAGIRSYLSRVKYSTSIRGTRIADGPQLLKVSDYDFDTEICDQILRGRQ